MIKERMIPLSTIHEKYHQLGLAQKTPKGVPAYTLYVNRRVGRMIAAASPDWVTPNGLTLASAALSYGALLLVWQLPPHGIGLYFVGLLLVLAFFIDSADGQLSRLRGGGSQLGGWLDHTLDAGRLVFLHITVAAYMFKTGLTLEKLAWCAVFLVSAVLIYIGGLLVEKGVSPVQNKAFRSSNVLLRSLFLLPVDFGLICVLFLLLPWPELFITGYTILAVLHAAYCALYLTKWVRELSSI